MKSFRFLPATLLAFFLAIAFSACSTDDDPDPDAQTPKITSISPDISTVLNLPKELSVGVEISDKGVLSYQWYVSDSKLSSGTAISEANAKSFSPETKSTGIFYYYCVITNRLGSSTRSVTSPRITYKVEEWICAQTPAILEQPQNISDEFGKNFSLSVAAYSTDGGNLSYQWYFCATEDGEGAAVEGATTSFFTGKVSATSLGYYWCVLTNTIEDNGDGGQKSSSVKTNKVILSNNVVNANLPVLTSQPQDTSAIIPTTRTFSVGAYSPDDGVLSFQWYKILEGETEGALIENATNSNYKATANEVGKTGYYCVISNTISDNGDGGTKTASTKSEVAWFEAVYLKDVVPAPHFTKQPVAMNIAPYNQTVTLSCETDSTGYSVSYKWYESSDGTTATGIAISNAEEKEFETPVFTERGIHYYYCVMTAILAVGDGDNVNTMAVISDVVSVAYTGLPIVYVNTPDSVEITSKEIWTENATISVAGSTDTSWNLEPVKTNIRGRGNSTWGQPKKPYAIKLDKKQSLLGMPKHKRWVLIANYLDNSFLRNEMAFYLSKQFELDYTVRGEFVDLILNGEYKGLYWLGEAIKPDENRVNINDGTKTITDEEDKDYLIEMDVYYDEPVKFHSSIRNMPYMIKNDDYMIDSNNELTSGGQARLERLQKQITDLEKLLYPDFREGMNTNDCSAPNESYSQIIDIDSWAKFWLVNEIMSNGELGHPKSCYFTFSSADSIFKAGPVWDFDWASLGQEVACGLKGTIYYNALFKSSAFKNRTKAIWNEYYSTIDISARIESMRSQISVAAEYDAKLWSVNHNPADITFNDFDGHVDFLKSVLINKFSIVTEEINSL